MASIPYGADCVQQVCTAGMRPIVDILTVNLMRWDVRPFCTIATDRTVHCHSKSAVVAVFVIIITGAVRLTQ